MTHFEYRSKRSPYRQIFLKLLFVYKLSYKKFKSVKHRVIGSLFRGQQLIKKQAREDLHTLIWIKLNEFDNSYTQLRCEFFLCNYYCSKWCHKHRICNWLVRKNKFRAATFWVTYFFRASILFLVLFFRNFLEKFSLYVM